MSTEQRNFLQEFKRQLIIYAMIGIITVFGTSIGFYYNTQNAIHNIIEKHQILNNRQNNIEILLFNLQQEKIDKVDVIREFDEVKKLLRDTNIKIDNIK